MPEKNKNNLKIILSIILIIVLIVFVVIVINKNQSNQNSKTGQIYSPIPEESMEVGEIGVLEEGKSIEEVNPAAIESPVRPINVPAPRDIFNTAGTILSVGDNFIIIRGNGTNFDDQIKRNLTIVIDSNTSIENLKGIKPNEALNVGDKVFVESINNIHGKQDFVASYINTEK